LPLSRNAMLTVSILSFIAAWSNYLWPLVITTKPEWHTISVTIARLFGLQTYTTIEIVMASALLAAFPPLLVYIVLQRYIINGIAMAGLNTVQVDFRPNAVAEGYSNQGLPNPLLADMSVHHFDLMRMVIGEDPVELSCRAWIPPHFLDGHLCFDFV
jgi:hypothetical protein